MLCLLASLAGLTVAAQVQGPVRTIQGIIREIGDSGAPLSGATVIIAKRSATTDLAGRFRIDSVPIGLQTVVIRRIGYQGVHTRMGVYTYGQDFWEYFMAPSPYRLEDEVVEARRTGIYGVVTTRFLEPLKGVLIEALGNGGGTMVTDSSGKFAFPNALVGAYMVRTTLKGYAERRLMVGIDRGKGVELSLALSAGEGRKITHADAAALFDLRHSLAFSLRREQMVGEELTRYGSLSLCDVPRIRATAGTSQVAILNGERVMLPGEMCSYTMDEVAMIQFSTAPSRRGAKGPVRGSTSVIIWEKW